MLLEVRTLLGSNNKRRNGAFFFFERIRYNDELYQIYKDLQTALNVDWKCEGCSEKMRLSIDMSGLDTPNKDQTAFTLFLKKSIILGW